MSDRSRSTERSAGVDRGGTTPAWLDRDTPPHREPLAAPDDRKGALVFTRKLLGSTPFLADLWDQRHRISDKPALICWGMEGPLFRAQALGRRQALFPAARTVGYPTAGHFVQEEKGVEMVSEARQFFEEPTDG